MAAEIVLGKQYRDVVSGWAGIATARYEYLNGCVRVELVAASKDSGEPKGLVFDREQLEFVDDGVIARVERAADRPARATGGPRGMTPVQR